MNIEEVAAHIVDSAVRIHKALGPGLLESAYQKCLIYELKKRGLFVQHEVYLPICYEGIQITPGYRLDMVVERSVVIENKTVDELIPVHFAQLMTYLKLGEYPLGFILNWRVAVMKDGIRRMVHNYSGVPGKRLPQSLEGTKKDEAF